MECYLVKNKNEKVRMDSRSGGFFSALAEVIFDKGGIVYGASLIDIKNVKHIRVDNKNDLGLLRGSKYIQSDIVETFENVKLDLKKNKWVLFSGTGCQTAAIKSYLKNENVSKLILLDIICHGVPSNRIWSDYCDYVSNKRKKKITNVDFRNKNKFGWESHYETFYFEDGTSYDSKYFKKLFMDDYILRPSCYKCNYRSVEEHISDFIIGDAWGIERGGFNDNKGVSLVIVKNEKAMSLFNECENKIQFKKCNLNDYLQKALITSFKRPKNREIFWKKYYKRNFVIFRFMSIIQMKIKGLLIRIKRIWIRKRK